MEWDCHLPARSRARHPWRLILHGGDQSTISGSTDPVDRTRAEWPLREGPCSRQPTSSGPAKGRRFAGTGPGPGGSGPSSTRVPVRNRRVPIVHRRAKRELDARAATGTIGCDEAGLPPRRVSVPERRSVIGGPIRPGRRGRAGRASQGRARRGERRTRRRAAAPLDSTTAQFGNAASERSGPSRQAESCYDELHEASRWPLRPEANYRCGLPGLQHI